MFLVRVRDVANTEDMEGCIWHGLKAMEHWDGAFMKESDDCV